jgi:hypothetical protein
MSIRSELLALKKADGRFVAEEAVTWAERNKSSKLYGALEWDDSVAGHHYRVWQMRNLITLHIVDPETGEPEVISLTIDRVNGDGGGYRLISDILLVPSMRATMLADALEELERIQQKYHRLNQLAGVFKAIDRVKNKLQPKQRRLSKQVEAEQSRRSPA